MRKSSYTLLCNFRATSLGLWVICYQISSHFLTGGLLVVLLMLLTGWVLAIIMLAPLGCWFYLVESGGHQPQNLDWIEQMTGPHLPGCLDCWFMASGIHTWSVSCIDSNIRSGRARASVLDSEGSQILPEDLGPGEPVSGLRPLKSNRKGVLARLWSRVDMLLIQRCFSGIKKDYEFVKVRQKTPILEAKWSVLARLWSRVDMLLIRRC